MLVTASFQEIRGHMCAVTLTVTVTAVKQSVQHHLLGASLLKTNVLQHTITLSIRSGFPMSPELSLGCGREPFPLSSKAPNTVYLFLLSYFSPVCR